MAKNRPRLEVVLSPPDRRRLERFRLEAIESRGKSVSLSKLAATIIHEFLERHVPLTKEDCFPGEKE